MTTHPTRAEAPVASSPAYPITLLIDAHSSRRVLFASTEPDAPGIAYFPRRTHVVVLGPSRQGRFPVRIDGPMPLDGHLDATALVARVRRSGRLPGTHLYVAVNDIVRVPGFADGTHASIGATAELSVLESGAVLTDVLRGQGAGASTRAITTAVGPYAIADLGADRVASPTESAPGTPAQLRSRATLFEDPEGTRVIDVEPARGSTCRILRVRGEFTAILLGTGPYVAGYVRSTEVEPVDPALFARAEEPPPSNSPWFVTQGELRGGPYFHVRAGTRVRVDGRVITTLRAGGYARVIARGRTSASVNVTVDGDVVVSGDIPLTALGEAVGAS